MRFSVAIDADQYVFCEIKHNSFMYTWILIADGVRGRLFKLNRAKKELIEIEDFLNPAGRLAEHSVLSDAPGRTFDRRGLGRHSMENRDASKEHAKESFAVQLAKHLDGNFKLKKFRRLILVAPPKFLGYMKHQLSGLECNDVVTHIAKDLTKRPPDEIYTNLSKQISNLYRKC